MKIQLNNPRHVWRKKELHRCLIILMRLSPKGFCNLRPGKDCSKNQNSVSAKSIYRGWNLTLHIMISLQSPLEGQTQPKRVNAEAWEDLAEVWIKGQTRISVLSWLRQNPSPDTYYFAHNNPYIISCQIQRICLTVQHSPGRGFFVCLVVFFQ